MRDRCLSLEQRFLPHDSQGRGGLWHGRRGDLSGVSPQQARNNRWSEEPGISELPVRLTLENRVFQRHPTRSYVMVPKSAPRSIPKAVFREADPDVATPTRDHMPHATAWVARVAGIPRHHVHMHMRHGLAGGDPSVEAHVVSIWLRIEPLIKQSLHPADE